MSVDKKKLKKKLKEYKEYESIYKNAKNTCTYSDYKIRKRLAELAGGSR